MQACPMPADSAGRPRQLAASPPSAAARHARPGRRQPAHDRTLHLAQRSASRVTPPGPRHRRPAALAEPSDAPAAEGAPAAEDDDDATTPGPAEPAEAAEAAKPGKTRMRQVTELLVRLGLAYRAAWAALLVFWEREDVKRVRLSWTLANLVAFGAGLASQLSTASVAGGGLSLLLAPALLTISILIRGFVLHAGEILPRLGGGVATILACYFANQAVQSWVRAMRAGGRMQERPAAIVLTASELAALFAACLGVLACAGVRVATLLLPAAAVAAFSGRDILHLFAAGFYLFAVQPFSVGDVLGSATGFQSGGGSAPAGPGDTLTEGTVVLVDLRYTHLKCRGAGGWGGRGRTLLVPNAFFLGNAFYVMDRPEREAGAPAVAGGANGAAAADRV